MVFWSSFAKKVKQAVSQVSFDLLKNRVQAVEQTNQSQDTKINANQQNITQLQTITSQHTQLIGSNTNNITSLDNKVDGVIQGLQNGNIVNYTGAFVSTKTYSIAEAVTYNNKWYVSNVNNNTNHTPTGSSDAYWELLSEPTINLTPYLTKNEASSTYATQNELNGFESNTTTTLNGLDSRISNLQSAKADKSYVDSLITYSPSYQLSSRLTWIKTKSENNRNWKWTGRLDNNIVPQNLINIEFELRGYDFSLTNQWYESIQYGWYKTPFYVIIWFESPDSQLDDYNLIARNTYIRFVSKR